MRLHFLIYFVFTGVAMAQTSYTKLQPELGTFDVGFNHYTTIDSTRTYNRWKDYSNKSLYRPIPISIWYPTLDKNKTSSVTILEYLKIIAEEEEWEGLPEYFMLDWFKYLPRTPENEQHLLVKTIAQHNAQPLLKKSPVVIYAPSYHASSVENFVLCEFLASQGYVVIASPSRGSETRLFQGGTVKDMETQSRDIAFLIKEAHKFPNVDTRQIATMGFSFGGLSNVLAQMQHEKINATISLDGSIKYQYETLKKSPSFNLEKVDVPFIHFAQKEIPQDVLRDDKIDSKLNTDFKFFEDITRGDAYKLQFNDLTHSNFSSLAILFENRDTRQDKSDSLIMQSYRILCSYVHSFLNAYLKNDSKSFEYIKNNPTTNGIPPKLVSSSFKKGEEAIFSFRDFHDLAIDQDYNQLQELYTDYIKKYPNIEFPEGKLNYIGLQLSYQGKIKESIRLFTFALELYPLSGNLYDSLAETFLLAQDKKKAILNFKKSLDLAPTNQNAINRLKQLE